MAGLASGTEAGCWWQEGQTNFKERFKLKLRKKGNAATDVQLRKSGCI
jgi:hypothetical protein